MSAEAQMTQAITQLMTSGISIFARQSDVIAKMLELSRNELEDYAAKSIGTGDGVIKINIPSQDLARLQLDLYNHNIPYATDISNEIKNAIKGDSLDLGSDLVTAIYVKDVDVPSVQNYITNYTKDREILKEYEDKQTAEKMFEGIDTCYVENLSPVYAEVIAKELEAQSAGFKRVYDKETNTVGLEIEASMFARLNENQFSRAEKALHDAFIKQLSQDHVNMIKFDICSDRLINDVILNEAQNKTGMSFYTVFDSFEPNRKINFEFGKAFLIDKNISKTFDLSNEKDIKELTEQINAFGAPSVLKTENYIKAIELTRKMQNFDFEKFQRAIEVKNISGTELTEAENILLHRIDRYNQAKELLEQDKTFKIANTISENQLNEICESSREEQLLDFQFKNNPQSDHKSVEIKLPKADDVFQLVLQTNPNMAKQFTEINDPILIDATKDEYIELINHEIESLEITNAAPHVKSPDHSYITDYEKFVLAKDAKQIIREPLPIYDNAEKLFDPAYDRTHDRVFDKDEHFDQDLDGILDEYELPEEEQTYSDEDAFDTF